MGKGVLSDTRNRLHTPGRLRGTPPVVCHTIHSEQAGRCPRVSSAASFARSVGANTCKVLLLCRVADTH